MKKKTISKKSTQTKGTLQMGLLDIIPETAPTILTSENTFSNFLLIVDAYFKKIYGLEIITTEEVMDKLDMFLSIFGE